ncbi:hypothetical protein FIU87_10720 [Bacillus sp. THAF10]|nr:hypothetical protein FIU87_10720 [Bacillus sp. THAF10]
MLFSHLTLFKHSILNLSTQSIQCLGFFYLHSMNYLLSMENLLNKRVRVPIILTFAIEIVTIILLSVLIVIILQKKDSLCILSGKFLFFILNREVISKCPT